MAGEPARVGHIPDGSIEMQQVDDPNQPALALQQL
jgi:hypothetical protein